jgi:hypothetical protein
MTEEHTPEAKSTPMLLVDSKSLKKRSKDLIEESQRLEDRLRDLRARVDAVEQRMALLNIESGSSSDAIDSAKAGPGAPAGPFRW